MDAYHKKEQIGTLFVRVGVLGDGYWGGGSRAPKPKNRVDVHYFFFWRLLVFATKITRKRRDIEHNPHIYLSITSGGVQASASQTPDPAPLRSLSYVYSPGGMLCLCIHCMLELDALYWGGGSNIRTFFQVRGRVLEKLLRILEYDFEARSTSNVRTWCFKLKGGGSNIRSSLLPSKSTFRLEVSRIEKGRTQILVRSSALLGLEVHF